MPMHLIALLCQDQPLGQALSAYRNPTYDFYLHSVPYQGDLQRVVRALEPLDFAGMLVLEPAWQRQAFELAARSSLDAQEVAAADALTVTPGGVIAEYNLGRAIGTVLQGAGWPARDASAVVLGTGPLARAVSRELSSLGVRRLAVVAKNRPVAEQAAQGIAASTEFIAKAEGDPLAQGLIERADLLVRIDASMRVDPLLLGPHLSVVDLSPDVLSPLRQQALGLGALGIGLREVQAHQLALSLGHILGGRLEARPFSELLHSL
jgi:shikimate 5-dehydrogenase